MTIIDKQEYHNRLQCLTKHIFNDHLARALIDKIVVKAESDSEYMGKFCRWLFGKESTVFFRDEIADEFKNSKIFLNSSHPLPFDNAWVKLDTYVMKYEKLVL